MLPYHNWLCLGTVGAYKKQSSDNKFEKKTAWLRDVLSLNKETFLKELKLNLFEDKILIGAIKMHNYVQSEIITYLYQIKDEELFLLKEFEKRKWQRKKVFAPKEPVSKMSIILFPFLAPYFSIRLIVLLLQFRYGNAQ